MGYRILLFDGCGDASAGIGDQLKSCGFAKDLFGDLEPGVRQLQEFYRRFESQQCHRGEKRVAKLELALTAANRRGCGYRLAEA